MIVLGLPGERPRLMCPDAASAAVLIADGEVAIAVDAPGDYVISADGLSVELYRADIAAERAKAWVRVKALRAQALHDPVTVAGIGAFDLAGESRTNLMAAALAAQVDPAHFAADWTLADNTIVTLDAAAIATVNAAIVARVNAIYARAAELRAEIEAAADTGTLDTIAITEGWN